MAMRVLWDDKKNDPQNYLGVVLIILENLRERWCRRRDSNPHIV